MNIFFIVFFTILSLMHAYIGLRIIPPLGLSFYPRIIAWVALTMGAILPVLPVILRSRGVESNTIDQFSLVGYISLGFFALTFIAVISKDFISICIVYVKKLLDLFVSTTPQTVDQSRRDFIQKITSIGIIMLTGISTIKGFYNARKTPTIIKVKVPIAGLSKDLDGLTIVQVSDLHVGPTIKKDYVEMVVDNVNKLNPDIIAFTGDLVDGSPKHLLKEMQSLNKLESKYGKYFVTGNHEYYNGVDRWLEETEKFGFVNLIDSHTIIKKGGGAISLGGITDYTSPRMKPEHKSDPKIAFAGSPKNTPKILLAHQPNSIFSAKKEGVALQISGHTHGGQFWPFTYAVRVANAYTAGLHNHDGTFIYVNSGTGYWGPPLRLAVASEITHITLKAA